MTTSITLSSQEKSPSPLRKTPWTETKLAQQVAAVAYDTLSAIRNSATAAKHWSYQAAKSAKLDTALGIGLSMGGGLLFVSGGMLVIDNMYDIKKHYRLKNWEGVSSKALLTAAGVGLTTVGAGMITMQAASQVKAAVSTGTMLFTVGAFVF